MLFIFCMRTGLLSFLFILLVILFSPIFVTISLILFLLSGPPILFSQMRVGKHGKIFRIYKFRTMENGAENKQSVLKHRNEAHGPVFKIHNDPRFTPIGKILSHTGLDELPQFFNIIRGDMALFGPRPLPIEEADKLTKEQQKRHTVKPGIISPWILEGYHRHSFQAWMASDIAYTQQKSLKKDLYLFFSTILLFFKLVYRELASRF